VKTTRKHYDAFKQEFYHWASIWIPDYEIQMEYPNEDIEACSAVIPGSSESKMAIVLFGKEWHDTKINMRTVRKYAFHECLEVFFEPLESLAPKKHAKRAREEVHRAINLITTHIFEPSHKRRFGS